MKPTQPLAELIVPEEAPWDAACKRTTYVAIATHPDDVEFMAWHAILECFQPPDKALGAVIVTDGRGSPRRGAHAGTTDEPMLVVRLAEQRKATFVGRYALHVIAVVRALPAELCPRAGGGLGEFAMDPTPLVRGADLEVRAYMAGLVKRFGDDVTSRIRRLRGH